MSNRLSQPCLLSCSFEESNKGLLVFTHSAGPQYAQKLCWKHVQKGWHQGIQDKSLFVSHTTTRLYLSGVDEQLVMEWSGHCSVEGIRSYKRTSREQQENVSDLLNGKKLCMDVARTDSTLPCPLTQRDTNSFQNPLMMLPFTSTSKPLPPLVSMPGMQTLTTNICAPQSSTVSTDHTGAFYFHSCSNITINFNHTPKTWTSITCLT